MPAQGPAGAVVINLENSRCLLVFVRVTLTLGLVLHNWEEATLKIRRVMGKWTRL